MSFQSNFTQKLDEPEGVSNTHGFDNHYGDNQERERPDPSQSDSEVKQGRLEGSNLGNATRDESFTVSFDGEYDPMYPRNMSVARKWAIVVTVCMGTVCV